MDFSSILDSSAPFRPFTVIHYVKDRFLCLWLLNAFTPQECVI